MRKFAAALLLCLSGTAQAVPIGGVDFPDGAISFADVVFSYTPGANVAAPYNDPSDALGIPDWNGITGNGSDGAVSLGIGGNIVLQFVDNSLTTSGDATEDLWIFEIGPAIEAFNVAISTNAISWIDIGNISGQPSGLDIDGVAGVIAGEKYSYVRLTDIAPNQSGSPYGEADIDAVGAISSAPPVPAPAPAVLALLGLGLVGIGIRRRIS